MNIENIKPLVDIEVKYIDDVKGFGVFTNQFIPKSTSVEICYTLKLSNASLGHPTFDYLFWNRDTKSHYLPLGFGAIYNHSDTHNLQWQIVPGEQSIMRFSSIRDIEIGEELTVNYGPGYWTSRNYIKKLL